MERRKGSNTFNSVCRSKSVPPRVKKNVFVARYEKLFQPAAEFCKAESESQAK